MCFILKSFCFYFVLTLASVFKSVTKCFWNFCLKKCTCEKKFDFEQVLKNYLPTRKRMFFSSYPLDSAILLLVSRYPYRWMLRDYRKGCLWSLKATCKDTLAFRSDCHHIGNIEGTRSFTERKPEERLGTMIFYDDFYTEGLC